MAKCGGEGGQSRQLVPLSSAGVPGGSPLEGDPAPCMASSAQQCCSRIRPGAGGLTCSSSIMRTERSLSSCCRSSIISRRRSSAFSSSQMSGEPIPSSLSSARRRFGEEPLNSCHEDVMLGNKDQI